MVFGYARVSRGDAQDPAAQLSALRIAGAERIVEEAASGGRWDRPVLHRLLEQLRPGDVFLVWKLDRLSRSLKDLLSLLELIEQSGASFRSVTESIDTGTPAGRMMMQMLGSFAEFERAMVRERTLAGLAAARAAGRVGGRRPKLDREQCQAVIEMVSSGQKTQAQAARLFGVHRSTISRLLTRHRQEQITRAPAPSPEPGTP